MYTTKEVNARIDAVCAAIQQSPTATRAVREIRERLWSEPTQEDTDVVRFIQDRRNGHALHAMRIRHFMVNGDRIDSRTMRDMVGARVAQQQRHVSDACRGLPLDEFQRILVESVHRT